MSFFNETKSTGLPKDEAEAEGASIEYDVYFEDRLCIAAGGMVPFVTHDEFSD